MVIEQISQMKQQGMPTNQIIQNLKQQGISPKEINEALSQSEIKSEISNNQNVFPGGPESTMQQQPPAAQPANNMQTQMAPNSVQQTPSNAQMEPSISQQPAQDPNQGMAQYPSMSTGMPTMDTGMVQQSTQDYSQYQEYGGDEYYPEYSGGGGGGADIETINDISSQIIDEKTKHFKKEFSQFTTYKKESQLKMEQLDKRLTKIEDNIEELKMAIIRKIGEYGEDIKHLSNEMSATQESFGKIIDPLATKAKAVKETIPAETKPTKAKAPKSNKTDSFEDYLR